MPRWSMALAAFLPALMLPGEEPAAPDAEQIAEWVKQLGSEDFDERQNAQLELRAAGELAVKALEEVAGSSGDLEIRNSAALLLPYVRAAKLKRVWKQAVQARWIPGLKEGRIEGPTLGLSPEITSRRPYEPLTRMPDDRQVASPTDDALMWLAQTQEDHGHWDAVAHGADYHADVEQTALALLALVGAGHTEKVGAYKQCTRKAVAWLLKHQRGDGAIINTGWNEADGLAHALAGTALAEAAAMGRTPDTKAGAQNAAAYSVLVHQSEVDGARSGFGRQPKSETPDLFTSAFFTMQLKTAKVAGLQVDPSAFEGLVRFLDSVDAKDSKDGGVFSYVPGGKASPEATLMGCFMRLNMGWKWEDLTTQAIPAIKAYRGHSAGKPDSDALINYLGAIVAFQQDNKTWDAWKQVRKETVLPAQNYGGAHSGSWNGSGRWSGAGRVFATALTALSLEIYCCYRPADRDPAPAGED